MSIPITPSPRGELEKQDGEREFYFTKKELRNIIHRVDRRPVITVVAMYCVSMDKTNMSAANIADMSEELTLTGSDTILPMSYFSLLIFARSLHPLLLFVRSAHDAILPRSLCRGVQLPPVWGSSKTTVNFLVCEQPLVFLKLASSLAAYIFSAHGTLATRLVSGTLCFTLLAVLPRPFGFSFLPIADNVTGIPNTATQWRSSSLNVPIMISICPEEGKLLVPRNTTKSPFIQLYLSESLVNQTQRDAIFARYQCLYKSAWEVMAANYTDLVWQCPQGILASVASESTHVFRWQFNKTIVPTLPPKHSRLGKFHGSDTMLLFSSSTLNQTGMSAELYAFARNVRSSIGNFVRTPMWDLNGRE